MEFLRIAVFKDDFISGYLIHEQISTESGQICRSNGKLVAKAKEILYSNILKMLIMTVLLALWA